MPSLVTLQCARLRERRSGSALDSCRTDASPTRKFCGNTCLCIEQGSSECTTKGQRPHARHGYARDWKTSAELNRQGAAN